MSFIFQSTPDTYDLRQRLKVGLRVRWLASRYRDKMRRGEVVYFWLAGDRSWRGLYGWGIITGDEPILVGSQYRIEIEYRCSFLNHVPPAHVSSDQLRRDPILQTHQIIKFPVGTNFWLEEEEDQALRRLIADAISVDWVPPPDTTEPGQDSQYGSEPPGDRDRLPGPPRRRGADEG